MFAGRDVTWLLCASETTRGRRRGGGVERRRRKWRKREVGAFEVGWTPLNETEGKKELQPVCVCVHVHVRR